MSVTLKLEILPGYETLNNPPLLHPMTRSPDGPIPIGFSNAVHPEPSTPQPLLAPKILPDNSGILAVAMPSIHRARDQPPSSRLRPCRRAGRAWRPRSCNRRAALHSRFG